MTSISPLVELDNRYENKLAKITALWEKSEEFLKTPKVDYRDNSARFYLNSNRIIIHTEGSALETLGYKQKDLEKKVFAPFLYAEDCNTFLEALSNVNRTKNCIGFCLSVGFQTEKPLKPRLFSHYWMSVRVQKNEKDTESVIALRKEDRYYRKESKAEVIKGKDEKSLIKEMRKLVKLSEERGNGPYILDFENIARQYQKEGREFTEDFRKVLEDILKKEKITLHGTSHLSPCDYTFARTLALINYRDVEDLGLFGLSYTYPQADGTVKIVSPSNVY